MFERFQLWNEKSLTRHLVAHGIPVERWGRGSRSVSKLLEEIRKGESKLITENDELMRCVTAASINVTFEKMTLRETKRIFPDGTEVARSYKGLSEKVRRGEKPLHAAYRGLKEELGVPGPFFLSEHGRTEESHVSRSFPGLKTRVMLHLFSCELMRRQFREYGYEERTKDGRYIIFEWFPREGA